MPSIAIEKSNMKGEVQIPPSKSQAHRAIICAALSKGVSKISPVQMSKDMEATIDAVKAIGCKISIDGDILTIDGTETFSKKEAVIDCVESGSTLRFLIPVVTSGAIEATFIGSGRLPERPIGAFLDLLPQHGVFCESSGGLPLKVKKQLTPGTFELAGDVSSQYITGFLLALPLLSENSQIVLSTPLQSTGYVDMTIDVMKSFGVTIDKTEKGYFIKGNQSYSSHDFVIESDWSQAGFFFTLGAIGGDVTIHGLRNDSLQGDKKAKEIFGQMGAKITESDNSIRVEKGNLNGIKVDVSQIPDLVPAIAVACAFADSESVIYNGKRLRIKESDRIISTVSALKAIGANVDEKEDGMIISPSANLFGGNVDGFNDHRIVMAFAMAGANIKGTTTISYMDSVKKSYPNFWEEWARLGGKSNVINLG